METNIVSMETRRAAIAIAGLEDHLGYWMRRVSNQVSGSFVRALQERDASAAEWVLLRVLWDRVQASPAELAGALGMTRGAISKVIAKAAAKEWLASREDPEDGRALLLTLTRRGQRMVPELAEIADRNDEQFFRCLSAKERAELRRLLMKLTKRNEIREVPVE